MPKDWSLVAYGALGAIAVNHPELKSDSLPFIPRTVAPEKTQKENFLDWVDSYKVLGLKPGQCGASLLE